MQCIVLPWIGLKQVAQAFDSNGSILDGADFGFHLDRFHKE